MDIETLRNKRPLDYDERPVVTRSTNPTFFRIGRGSPRLALISEPGPYKLIQSSTKPQAKAFDCWVRHEVFPAIRKDGMYVAGEDNLVRPGSHS